MPKPPLVSIVIPIYNRAHLIGETLDSIIEQSYTNWECLLVDDGSTDTTIDAIRNYASRDKRIKHFVRPDTKPKGANTCRNIGLNNAQGAYVVFFDSDDLMTRNHLEIKINAIKTYDCDYVITRAIYFNNQIKDTDRYYAFGTYKLTPYNYLSQNINWLTCDICLISSLAKRISFNEKLKSGQEYNYFSKLVYMSCNAVFIDSTVSLIRPHNNSIRSKLDTQTKRAESYSITKWYTYLEIKHLMDKDTSLVLMRACLHAVYKEQRILVPEHALFCKEVIKVLGFRGLFLLPMVWSLKLFGKGYYFRQQLFKAFPD